MKLVSAIDLEIGDFVLVHYMETIEFGKVVGFESVKSNGRSNFVVIFRFRKHNEGKYYFSRDFYKLTNEEAMVEMLKLQE